MKKIVTCLIVLGLALACYSSVSAQEIIFTTQTTTGTEVVTPVLTWDTHPAADDCIATGDWVGAKGPSGTETLPDITSSATYNLICNWLEDSVRLDWIAPTENTDGTPLTDLASYSIYQGSGPDDRSGPVYKDIDAGVVTYVVEPLSLGSYCWVGTAINARGIESIFSNETCKIVGESDATQSVGITVNPKPNSPTGLTAS